MSQGFEEILKGVGVIGRKQIEVFFLVSLADVMTSWTILIPIFIGAQPEWICPSDSNGTSSWSNGSHREDAHDDVSKILAGNLSTTNSTKNMCSADNNICSGITYTSPFTSMVTEWNLVCDLEYVSDIITTIQMAGLFFGALAISQLSDMFGRKPVWYAALTVNSIVGFASAFAPRWEVMAAMRFINGMCAGGLLLVSFAWPLEFVGIKWRIYLNVLNLWTPGSMLLPLLAYYIRDWKTLLMVTTPFPTVFVWFLWKFMLESPRWLAMQERLEEAEEVLSIIAKANGKSPPSVETLKQFIEEEKKNAAKAKKFSFWDLFRTPQLAKHTLVLMFLWFVYGAAFYGISLNVKNLPGDKYLNSFLLAAVEIPALAVALVCGIWLGRRVTMFGTLLIGGLAIFSVLFIGLAGKLEELSVLVTCLSLLGKCGVMAAWNLGYLVTGELFPTVVRSIGGGAASIAGRAGGVTAPQFASLGRVSRELPFIVFGSLAVVAAFFGLLLPETKMRRLPDSLPEWSWCSRKPYIEDEVTSSDKENDDMHGKSKETISTDL
ncbi:organic cation transporter protein [Lingula anatina]|uniref:Organic cation transporter protein n=1 Tax=Lingula anatina TaxID=7574 RepID=A0A1S3J150_LINAN|nr:organic cation transporter protein [Lingula anatina]|eukprot:XP_013403534.1 organic cation transporter protein [Lingula anatina]